MAQKYRRLTSHTPLFWLLIALHVLAVAAGVAAALYMETHGHGVTGMSNQIVWGAPHVFAVFLIVSASGALNVASVSSVFNRLNYKPFARLSGILAIALLIGGLTVLVLDLGRPERVFVAMTTYNFRSIFAWNIYLYSGFVAIVAFYLFAMMDRRASRNQRLRQDPGLDRFRLAAPPDHGHGIDLRISRCPRRLLRRDHGAPVHRLVAGLRARLHRSGARDHVSRDERPARCPRRWSASFAACSPCSSWRRCS